MSTSAGTPEHYSRRRFLSRIGMTGGAAALYGSLEALGLVATNATAQAESVQFVPPSGHEADGRRKKVVILGAGTAGLTVAYELGKAGYDCRVIEARDRPGGRAWTVRQGDKHTDTDGVTQTAKYDKGHYFNAGPSRIPSHHVTLDYCRELGVAIEPFINANAQGFYYNENTPTTDYGPLASTTITHRQAKADAYGYVAEILATVANQGALDSLMSANDVERLIAFANSFGGLTGGKYVGNNRRGYATPPGAGDQPGTIAGPPPSMSAVLQNQLGDRFAFEFGYDQAMMMWQPVGGMDRISAALADKVGRHRIAFNAEVTAFTNTANGVSVTYKRNGKLQKVDADYAVVTIPPMVLKTIPSNLTQATKDALNVPVGSNTGRMGIQFKRRFWEQDFKIFGGVTHTNLDVSGIYYPSYGYLSGGKGVVVGYYTGAYTNLSVADRVTRALDQGAKIHGEVYKNEYDNAFSVAWPKVPYSLGGWVQWPGGRGAAYLHLQQPDGNIYFAGDHLSYYTAWQNGAFLSARKVVMDLHQRVTATS